ncbi:MAG TPA: tRNA uridine(34) 5-carboxymethylaminomethyl modification radical SAM/GNAT enzyme Elp3 [bacterium]
MDAVAELLNRLDESPPENPLALRRMKIRIAGETGAGMIRNDALLARYRADVAHGSRSRSERLERALRLNAVRSHSGIATVTVITKPFPCPGRCVYCPTEARAPKSYLTNEPAMRRAVRNEYDPFRQVSSRLEALADTGHATDKIELIVKGGTWSFYPEDYQVEFIQRCFEAATAFGLEHQNGHPATRDTLDAAQRANETAASRIIGLTIETRPDYIAPEELRRLRRLGVTRVELGVQTLDEAVLALTVRDHGTAEVRTATRLLKDAAFKVAYHLMPNLPGATPDGDLASMRRLFDDPAYQPDAIKIYPCVVIESAELYQWWRDGRHRPYDDETLIELLAAMKALAPPHVRIERVIRDIPSTSIRAGCAVTNLREEVHRRMRARGQACRCVRCRQVQGDAAGAFTLVRREYGASDGTEMFLSMEDADSDRLASLLRLRRPSPSAWRALGLPALEGAALIRELHSYGPHLALHERRESAVQHQGFGRRLLQEAERIAREEFGAERLAVISGIGAREYYRKLGYALSGTYMVKALPGAPT